MTRAALTVLAATLGAGVTAHGVARGTSVPDKPSPADQDFAAACSFLANLPETVDFSDDGWAFDQPWIWRLQAVTGGFAAAARADDRYADLDEIQQALMRAHQRFDFAELDDALGYARQRCRGAEPTDTSSPTPDDDLGPATTSS